MMTTIGQYGLSAAVLVAAGTLLVSFAAARFGSKGLYRAVRRGSALLAILLTICSIALTSLMLSGDFSVQYVARFTEKALPFGYKLAAFWAGQEGSLLLWGWLLAVMGVIFAYTRREDTPQRGAAIATVAVVVGFFATLMLFAANPFTTFAADEIPLDGHGLNPMLQNPGMIAHPPLLFLGYAGFTIPFALLVGSLIAGRSDKKWLDEARPWVMISWIFLTAGILLGAQWAYVELGWGGYWAWDPVENASLLPWLTGTALLHSIIAQRTRGIFKRWTAFLGAVTFMLCIFGTYLTRSGVVDSVHSFGKSMIGTFFGVFLILCCIFSILIIAIRWNQLRSERKLEALLSREGAFLAGNILFVAMTAFTLFGTMYPAISGFFGKSQSVNQSFYNKRVLPMALLAVAIMAISPLLTYGKSTLERLMRNLAVPLLAAAGAAGVCWTLGAHNPWALASAAVATVIVVSVGLDLVRGIRSRQANTAEGLFVAALRLLDSNHRRYGSHIVHVGVALIVAGIAGSSLYNSKQEMPIRVGSSVDVGRYHVTLKVLRDVHGENYAAKEAEVEMVNLTSGQLSILRPQFREYNKAENPSAEVAINPGWREDLYVTLAGYDLNETPGIATLGIIINPLVNWIWAGGVILGIGAVICLIPRLQPRQAPIPVPLPAASMHTPRKKLRRQRAIVSSAH